MAQYNKQNALDNYVTVAERIASFYNAYPTGRILTTIVQHDQETGFILMRAEVYRNTDDTLPAATGHAFEVRSESYVNKTSYVENCETGATGRALALLGFEVRRGLASREEMEKVARMTPDDAAGAERERPRPVAAAAAAASRTVEPAVRPVPRAEAAAPPDAQAVNQSVTDDQKEDILNRLELLRPGDRRAQRQLLMELTGKASREELTQAEATRFIDQLKREQAELSR